MNIRIKYFLCLLFPLLFSSCGMAYIATSHNEESESEEILAIEEESQVLCVCPMCDGNRLITDIYTGEIIYCPACKGDGVVTNDLAEQLLEAERIGIEIAGGNPDDVIQSYGNSDLQLEIEQCEREIENLENTLSLIDESSTLYAYYSAELVNLKYRLRELQLRQ